MHPFHFWSLFGIHWRKITTALFLIGILWTIASETLFAQRMRELNLPFYDDRKMHYGLFFGVHHHAYNLRKSQYFVDNQNIITAVQPLNAVGLSFGFILNRKLTEHVDVRVLPGIAFYERKIRFVHIDASEEIQTSESTFFEIPLLVKYKSLRRLNSRLYFVGGLKPGIEARSKKKEKSDKELRTRGFDLSLELGVGLDQYFRLAKFSPELRISLGLLNTLVKDENEFAKRIDRLTSKTVSLLLYFE